MSQNYIALTILTRTVKTDKLPDISGFLRAMEELGGKVTTEKDKVVVKWEEKEDTQ